MLFKFARRRGHVYQVEMVQLIGSAKVGNFEPGKNWFEIRRIRPNLLGMVIGRDNYEFGTNINLRSLNFRGKWITICPDLEMMAQAVVFLVEILNEDCFMGLVVVPPLIAHLEVCIGVVGACLTGLTSTRSAIVPEVFHLGISESDLFPGLSVVIFNEANIMEPDLVRNVFDTTFFGGFADLEPALSFVSALIRFGLREGTVLDKVFVLLTVVRSLFGSALSDLYVSAGPNFVQLRERAFMLEVNVALEVRSAAVANFVATDVVQNICSIILILKGLDVLRRWVVDGVNP